MAAVVPTGARSALYRSFVSHDAVISLKTSERTGNHIGRTAGPHNSPSKAIVHESLQAQTIVVGEWDARRKHAPPNVDAQISYVIVTISSSISPAGRVTVTTSPIFFFKSARPIGDCHESRPFPGSDSSTPTNV